MSPLGIEAAWVSHTPALQRFVRRFTKSADQAEEVAAATWGRAVASWHHLAPNADVLGWLCRIARNLVIDQWRRQPVGCVSVDENVEDNLNSPADLESDVINRERIALVRRAFDKLIPSYQRALALAWTGFPPNEVATKHRILRATVKTRYFRARQGFAVAYAASGGY